MTHGQALADADPSPHGAPAVAQGAAPSRDRLVRIYVALAFVAVLPGLARRFGVVPDALGPAAAFAADLWRALDDIRFGTGLRFWLGVAGASAMALTLLYPLRKWLAGTRLPGSIGAWFHVHLLLGCGGPVLVLYHADFGHGGSNANIALWCMLVVAVGGVAGHFVYRRASLGFYGERAVARRHLDDIAAALQSLDTERTRRDHLLATLEESAARLLSPRPGVIAALAARVGLRRVRREVIFDTLALLDAWMRSSRIDAAAGARVRHEAVLAIETYFRLARRTATRALGEQLAAQWRLLHLPVFLVMCVAATLHVIAVWNMDAATSAIPAAPLVPGYAETATDGRAPGRRAPAIQQVRRQTISIEGTQATATLEPPLLQPPKPAVRATNPPAEVETRQPAPAQPRSAPVEPNPPVVAAAKPAAEPARTRTEIAEVYAELEKRTGVDKMKLGGAEPRTLADQLAALKARFKAKTFLHNLDETGFALTGRHVSVDCAGCHQKPLRDVRSEAPRACVACHRKDDVHRGRRPDCARCHTPNRWSEIVRR